jgi:hypothetical protein
MNERAQEIASGLPPDLDALPRLGGFRLRGIAMTRLETFVDAAFAFAITMLCGKRSRQSYIEKAPTLIVCRGTFLRFLLGHC